MYVVVAAVVIAVVVVVELGWAGMMTMYLG